MKKSGHYRPRILIAALLTATACAPGIETGLNLGPDHDSIRPVQINVVNNHSGPMEVYVTGSGRSYRLGTVYPGIASHFVLRPGGFTGTVELLASPRNNGPIIRSGLLLLAPGAVVDFQLGASPVNSEAWVRS